MLRTRKSRREEPLTLEQAVAAAGPEQEAVLADSVGLAMLVVLDTLAPAERVAFVLHDMFGLPFGEIGAATGRSAAATRQLASRARRRVRGTTAVPGTRLARQREVAAAYLAAARGGDMGALLTLLDPDVELYADGAAAPQGVPMTLRGAAVVATTALAGARRSRYVGLALINGSPGIVLAPAAGWCSRSPSPSRTTGSPGSRSSPTRTGSAALTWRFSAKPGTGSGPLPATAVGSAGRVRHDHGEGRDHQRDRRDGDRRGR